MKEVFMSKLMKSQTKNTHALFERVKNIKPVDHPALKVKGRKYLIGSNESYMPEKIKAYDGSWPPSFEYQDKKSDSQKFVDDLFEFSQTYLKEYGCFVVKGAPIKGHSDYSQMIKQSQFNTTKYQGGTTFRSESQNQVYTPTNENPGITMESHWDQPYWVQPPKKLMFYYPQPAEDGVNNMIDGRQFLKSLDKDLVDKFEKTKIQYLHYYSGEGDSNKFVSWQRSMGENKEEVEQFLKEQNCHFEWINGGKDLVKWEISPALKNHPQSDEICWQNNISGHHGSYFHDHFLFPELQGRSFTDPNKFKGLNFNMYPHTTKYGDGTDIDYETIKYLRKQLWNQCVGLMAEAGDIVMVDNYLAGHGRLGYTPPREAYISIITN